MPENKILDGQQQQVSKNTSVPRAHHLPPLLRVGLKVTTSQVGTLAGLPQEFCSISKRWELLKDPKKKQRAARTATLKPVAYLRQRLSPLTLENWGDPALRYDRCPRLKEERPDVA